MERMEKTKREGKRERETEREGGREGKGIRRQIEKDGNGAYLIILAVYIILYVVHVLALMQLVLALCGLLGHLIILVQFEGIFHEPPGLREPRLARVSRKDVASDLVQRGVPV